MFFDFYFDLVIFLIFYFGDMDVVYDMVYFYCVWKNVWDIYVIEGGDLEVLCVVIILYDVVNLFKDYLDCVKVLFLFGKVV